MCSLDDESDVSADVVTVVIGVSGLKDTGCAAVEAKVKVVGCVDTGEAL